MGQITLKQVAKRFGDVEVIPPLDLEIADGEFVVFVGPSGCGKSTLLRLIAGLEDVSGGHILIDGKDATTAAPAQRGLAMVFQSYALYPHMSVKKNIAFPMKMAGMPVEEQERRIAAAAKALNLTDYLDRRPGQLSGGQRQRVAIGRAIVREPAAFLFDEPLSNLDAALRVGMRLEISELHKRLATTMIYVTHDQVEAMTMADRIVVMQAGRIEQIGTPLALYDRPMNTFVAQFIGSPAMNLFEARFKGGELVLESGEPTGLKGPVGLKEGKRVIIGKRPEEIRLSSDGHIRAEVENIEPTGSETFIETRSGDRSTLIVLRERPTFRTGDTRYLHLEFGMTHYFDAETRIRIE